MIRLGAVFKLSLITTLLVSSVATSQTDIELMEARMRALVDEKAMDSLADTATLHDRKQFAAVAHAKATAHLSQATYVYTMHLRLNRQNATSEMDLLESETEMLSASVAHSYTEYAMKHEGLKYDAGQLKAKWASGTIPKDLKQLANLYVQIRQHYLEHSEFLMAEFTKLLNSRERIVAIKTDLEKRRVISDEELNQAIVVRDQTISEIEIAKTQLTFARQALLDAQKDLESIGR
jgi:protein-arginine kinase activator protein McsA